MAAPRILLASLFLPALAFPVPAAQAEAVPPGAARAEAPAARPLLMLAEKGDDEKGKDRKGRRKDKNDGKGAGAPGGGERAKDARQKRKDAEPAKDAARKQTPSDGPPAGDKTPGQRQEGEARRKAFQDKQQQAKENALRRKQEGEAARRDAIRQKQLDAQQAREKAQKQKQDADAARQKAVQDRRDAEAARQKAIKDKQDAEAARRKSGDDKQQQAKDDWRKGQRGPGKFDRAKADQEFERARKEAERKGPGGRGETFRPDKASRFEALRKERKTRAVGARDIIIEPDKRVIVRDEKRIFIRHDDSRRFTRREKELRRERRKDGTWLVVTAGLAGAMIYSILDDNDRVLRRSRKGRDGREYVLFDDRRAFRGGYGPEHTSYIDLPPPQVRIPRDRYIVEYDRASPDDLYDALNAPPIEPLDRGYTLDEVRQNYSILERMRRVDLNAINFEFASWDVTTDQYPTLERMARAIRRVLDRSPGELFLIEGHTDAVGSEIDNLSLSDRRAETVAIILTDEFGIPAENLTTQGYGEEYLKEPTDGPSWINRRVAVRRITPLLSREGWDDDPS